METVKEYRVLYFASLRDLSGRAEERRRSAALTPRGLYDELRGEYGFELDADRLRVAVDDAFTDWSQPLYGGETIAFIPPVSGG